MGEIRIAIVGVGNCASSLIQGIYLYGRRRENEAGCERTIGLIHEDIGGYRVGDIRVVAAFDIDERKVGEPINEAIFSPPNCTKRIVEEIPPSDVIVEMGEVFDSVSAHMKDFHPEKTFIISNKKPCDVRKVLRDSGAEIVVNFLPVGSEKATGFYAECCLKESVAFINCIPVFVASNEKWSKRFEQKGVPLIGDDIKSQLGATILNRALVKLFKMRGIKIDRLYQLNVGGNTDFLNMMERRRLKSKKISKTEAIQSIINEKIVDENIHIGPSDFVPWLKDNKICFLRIEGRGFGGIPVEIDVKLSVEDSPNSAAVVLDAIRLCKIAIDRKIGGVLKAASAYAMKRPPVQMDDEEAIKLVDAFIKGEIER